MDQLSKIGPFAALSRLWNELNSSQRVVVAAFLALSVVTIVIIGMAASKPRMTVLFSRLEPEDAGAIVQKLSEQKVPYKLSADNSTIEVPEGQVDDLRLQMVTAGLPQGGTVGFELFDKSSFGMTEFAQRLNYQRAIQGELTRTIEHLAPVVNARVHVAIPEDQVYESEQQPVTASVVLKLRRGMPLTDDQVGGVIHLVSSAVEGLKPSNVTVIDSEGTVLSEALTAGGRGGQVLTANQSKLKRQYETELAANLQSMLARIVGADKAVVRVSADMNFDHKQTKSESYEPAKANAAQGPAQGILLTEETKSEGYTGGQVPAGAVPNRRQGVSAGDTYTHTESSSQYQVTKRLEETVSAPGQVKRLSVAVLVDEKVDPTKIPAIKEAVTAAAGIDPTRNDQVTVQRIGFDTSAKKTEEAEAASASKSQLISTIGKNAAGVLLLFVFLFFLKGIVKQIKVQAPSVPAAAVGAAAPAPMPTATPTGMADLMAEQPGTTYAAPEPTSALEDKFSTAPQSEPPPKEVAQSSPEELAKLVRTWISE